MTTAAFLELFTVWKLVDPGDAVDTSAPSTNMVFPVT